MSKVKFAAAKELIEQQRYTEARVLLKTINHPTAREWLTKLDRLDPPQRRSSANLIIAALLIATVVVGAGTLLLLQRNRVPDAVAQSATDSPLGDGSEALLQTQQAETQVVFDKAATQRSDMATIMAASPTTPATSTPAPTETSIPPTTPPEPTLTSDKWTLYTETSAIDDTTTVTLALEAEGPVRTWLREEYPLLVLRCDKGYLEAFVATGSQLAMGYGRDYDRHRIRIRYDRNPAETREMLESTSGEALFFGEPTAEIQAMLRHDQLIVAYSPYNAGEAETIFNLTGLQEAIQPLLDACPRNSVVLSP